MFGDSTAKSIMAEAREARRQSKQGPPTRTAIRANKQDER